MTGIVKYHILLCVIKSLRIKSFSSDISPFYLVYNGDVQKPFSFSWVAKEEKGCICTYNSDKI